MTKKYQYYDGGQLRLASDVVVNAGDVIEVEADTPYADYVTTSPYFTEVEEKPDKKTKKKESEDKQDKESKE